MVCFLSGWLPWLVSVAFYYLIYTQKSNMQGQKRKKSKKIFC